LESRRFIGQLPDMTVNQFNPSFLRAAVAARAFAGALNAIPTPLRQTMT